MILPTILPIRLWRHYFNRSTIKNWTQDSGPAWLILSVFVDALLFESINFPILHRHYYYILLRIGFAAGVAWLILRLVTWGMEKLKNRAITHGRPEAVSLVLLSQRLIKAFVLVRAGLAIIRAFGFDTSTVLAGVEG